MITMSLYYTCWLFRFFSIENILKVQKAVPESAVTKCQALSFKGVESTKESLVVKFRFYLWKHDKDCFEP